MPTPLPESEVRRLLDPEQLIAAIEFAFRNRFPSITIPDRTIAHLPHGMFLTMSCYDAATPALGMKLVMLHNQEPAQTGLNAGRVQATYLLLDPETAEPRLTISANYLTDLRTAATSAVATKFLARPDSETLGIFGTGRLARTHIKVLPRVRDFRRVLICGRDPGRTSEFVREASVESSAIQIAAADLRTCAAESDVICTCTSSSTPVFDGRDLRPGTHLNLVGTFQPHAREADTATMQRANVVMVDTHATAQSEFGELLLAQKEKALPHSPVTADLHELVSGKKPGRKAPEEITVFKSVGCALEDLVAAELLLAAQSHERV
ncbi:MAG TPA: ornithine cyclodeaminase family protein [Candidatus Solibacter sp.]|nr:ornithine cyclodeaminase family protein [Candidatus Solibacter sp.]